MFQFVELGIFFKLVASPFLVKIFILRGQRRQFRPSNFYRREKSEPRRPRFNVTQKLHAERVRPVQLRRRICRVQKFLPRLESIVRSGQCQLPNVIFKIRVVDVAQLNFFVPPKIFRDFFVAEIEVRKIIAHRGKIFLKRVRNCRLALHEFYHRATFLGGAVRQIFQRVGKIFQPLKIFAQILRGNIFDRRLSPPVKFLKKFFVRVEQREEQIPPILFVSLRARENKFQIRVGDFFPEARDETPPMFGRIIFAAVVEKIFSPLLFTQRVGRSIQMRLPIFYRVVKIIYFAHIHERQIRLHA